jgi:probable phosphoglycerate mutase
MTGCMVSLVRHGHYDLLDRALGGRADHALSAEGRAQAARAGEALRRRGIATVFSSPVQRARETAEIIAEAAGAELREEPAFAEVDFGDWTGASFDALQDDLEWRAWNTFRGAARPPGGELMLEVQARAVGSLLRIAAAHPGGEIAVVSHSDVIKSVLAHLLGSPLDLMRRIEISAGSVSRIALYPEDAKVLVVNAAP